MHIALILAAKKTSVPVEFWLMAGGALLFLFGLALAVGTLQKRILVNWAAQYGLQYNAKGLKGIDDITGTYKGLNVCVRFPVGVGLSGAKPSTEFEAHLPSPLSLEFELRAHNRIFAPEAPTHIERHAIEDSRLGKYELFAEAPDAIPPGLHQPDVIKLLVHAADRCNEVWVSDTRVLFKTAPVGFWKKKLTRHFELMVAVALAVSKHQPDELH